VFHFIDATLALFKPRVVSELSPMVTRTYDNDEEFSILEETKNLKTFDYNLDPKKLISSATELCLKLYPHWGPTELKSEELCDGITNKLVKFTHQSEKILIRTYGLNTSIIIDRERELMNMIKLSINGLAPKAIARFNNGIVYGFAEGRVYSVGDLSDSHKGGLIAKKLKIWHQLSSNQTAQLFPTIRKWLKVLPELYTLEKKQTEFENAGFSLDKVKNELLVLEEKVKEFNSPVVFCHNDLLSGNIIYNPKKGICN
jgi:ethanolamine kinase